VLDLYREIVLADFEFEARQGERPVPVCCVAHEFRSGRWFRIWQDEFRSAPPYAFGFDVLFVAFYAPAELGCYRQLGWPIPERILDLFTEFRNHRNGLGGRGRLLDALVYFGLDTMSETEKKDMQESIGNGTWRGKFSPAEIMDYCQHDVEALARLLPVMAPAVDLPRALLRGRYMAAVSAMERNGTPIDTKTLALLRESWGLIKDRLIAEVDKDYGVYDGTAFRFDWFAALLQRLGIPWPRTKTGRLATDDETFREIAKAHPVISPLRELRHALGEMRLNDLAVGADGRNRTMLSPFASRTGRNQPSNTRYIFGPSVWLRGLIKPPPGYGCAYIDWSQQEFGIAAVLSGDRAMQEAYLTGDPYLAFAKQAGALPADATRKDSAGNTIVEVEAVREQFKQCVLGLQYSMGAESLADRIDQPIIVANNLLQSHHEVFRDFWKWSDGCVDHAMLYGWFRTVFGWYIQTGINPNPRSLRNFPMQANGGEMLRIACCLATERGVEVSAPVHDAILISAPLDRLDADIAATRAAMAEASRAVLAGFELGSDVNIVRYPDRYMDKRGWVMWDRVMRLLADRIKRMA
jgi:DNA polymerase I